MTAKELIEHLRHLPPETKICVRGYEGGLDYACKFRQAKIINNVNKEWYYGQHEEVDDKSFKEIVWVIQ